MDVGALNVFSTEIETVLGVDAESFKQFVGKNNGYGILPTVSYLLVCCNSIAWQH